MGYGLVLTNRTEHEPEGNPRARPSLIKGIIATMVMEDMTTFKLYGWGTG
jgi:hypothetical protein